MVSPDNQRTKSLSGLQLTVLEQEAKIKNQEIILLGRPILTTKRTILIMKYITIETLKSLVKEKTEIYCGSVERFNKYLDSQIVFVKDGEFPKEPNMTTLYGVPIVESKIIDERQVAVFNNGLLVHIFQLPD
tara:strand:+ start:14904 stop:15299 length:396 start_codon:yes stop_codon:yes gene_type:complete